MMPVSVLFLCTGNSCRSIMAEALLAHHGGGRFLARSAGSFPTGEVHPLSIATLAARGVDATGCRSKSWDEFAGQPVDAVITVCDAAAGESCPVFPGAPVKAHWGVPDPSRVDGSRDIMLAEFARVCDILERRVRALVALPQGLSRDALHRQLTAIAQMR